LLEREIKKKVQGKRGKEKDGKKMKKVASKYPVKCLKFPITASTYAGGK